MDPAAVVLPVGEPPDDQVSQRLLALVGLRVGRGDVATSGVLPAAPGLLPIGPVLGPVGVVHRAVEGLRGQGRGRRRAALAAVAAAPPLLLVGPAQDPLVQPRLAVIGDRTGRGHGLPRGEPAPAHVVVAAPRLLLVAPVRGVSAAVVGVRRRCRRHHRRRAPDAALAAAPLPSLRGPRLGLVVAAAQQAEEVPGAVAAAAPLLAVVRLHRRRGRAAHEVAAPLVVLAAPGLLQGRPYPLPLRVALLAIEERCRGRGALGAPLLLVLATPDLLGQGPALLPVRQVLCAVVGRWQGRGGLATTPRVLATPRPLRR
mmetsp:Transcript_95675/g.285643  ORF Transcript_95675/g.285643 Transcript_95675/m.285643 type:complete len:314 (-) Transcript_95675:351-1292(-)